MGRSFRNGCDYPMRQAVRPVSRAHGRSACAFDVVVSTRGMTRAVVDTSVLVSALIGDPDAGAGRLVDAWREQRFVLVVSPKLLAELREVLARPKLERWAGEGRGSVRVGICGAQRGAR
jgi:hypothetical protein